MGILLEAYECLGIFANIKSSLEEFMDIQTTYFKRCTLVKTSGRIDGSNAPTLAQKLKEITGKGVHNIVFDMSEVTFVASAGWWVLIDTQKTCKPSGELVLVKVEKGIKDSLNLVGMGSYFRTYDDVTTAVGDF
jgi:anti-anti-sigma factor